jgi:hypothetical protein
MPQSPFCRWGICQAEKRDGLQPLLLRLRILGRAQQVSFRRYRATAEWIGTCSQ